MPIYTSAMGKKSKSLPKDELIDHLLEDANEIADDSKLNDGATEFVGAADSFGAPDNLFDPDAAQASEGGTANVWSAIEDHAGVDAEFPETYEVPENSHVVGAEQVISPGVPLGTLSAREASIDATVPLGVGDTAANLGLKIEELQSLVTQAPPTPGVPTDDEATIPVGARARHTPKLEPKEKVVVGALRGNHRSGNVFTSTDASLQQAETLKIAQQRILELEQENDRYRQENEEISSAADVIRTRLEEMNSQLIAQERDKGEVQENFRNEIAILKGNLQFKESEVGKARLKNEELEMRLRNDFRKIRVKERELENRLELARAEKAAVARAKDENILELKRKIDQLQGEIENYREKCQELNKTIESHQEQFKRTVRALRVALTNLEVKDENLILLKKAD